MRYLKLLTILIIIISALVACDSRNEDLPDMSFSYPGSSFVANYQNYNDVEVIVSLDGIDSYTSEKRINLTYDSEALTVVTGTGQADLVVTDNGGIAQFTVVVDDSGIVSGNVNIQFQMDDYNSVKETFTLYVHDIPRLEASNIDFPATMNYATTAEIEVQLLSDTNDHLQQSIEVYSEYGSVDLNTITTDDTGSATFFYTAPAEEVTSGYIDFSLSDYPEIDLRINIDFE